jgi:hypothetical protein
MPADGRAIVRHGLAATALLTLAMALPWPSTWPTLRFLAGVVSGAGPPDLRLRQP